MSPAGDLPGASAPGSGPARPFRIPALNRRRALLSRRRITGALLAGLGLLLLLWNPQPLHKLDLLAQDALSRHTRLTSPPPGAPKTVLILLGEKSLREVHQWPWPRRLYAELLGALEHASLVVFDVTMPERSTPEDDTLFSEAVRKHGRVIMALYVTPNQRPGGPEAKAPPLRFVFPYQELFDAAAGFGVVNVEPDPDGIIRRSPLLWQAEGLTLPSLPMAVPLALGWEPRLVSFKSGPDKEPDRRQGKGQGQGSESDAGPDKSPEPGQGGGYHLRWEAAPAGENRTPAQALPPAPAPLSLDDRYAVRFLPSAPDNLTIFEYTDLLAGNVPQELLRGAVVVIGISAPGASDMHRVPGGGFLPGSILVAEGIRALWRGDALSGVPLPAVVAVAVLFLAGTAAAALRSGIRRGACVFFLLCLAWLGLWAALMQAHLILPLAGPLAAGLFVFTTGACYSFFVLEKDWAVRSLPLETVLLAPKRRAFTGPSPVSGEETAEEADFAAELRRLWPKIDAMCGCVLLEAEAPADHPAVAPLLAEAGQGDNAESILIIVPEASAHPPRNRMLVPLSSADNEKRYALVGWSGAPRIETLKSVAALIVSLASQHAFAEAQARNQAMLFATIRAIAGAIDAKDPITAGHSERVAALARDLAFWLGHSEEKADEVFFAGILHDVGKIGVPDAVLNKNGKLTDEEFTSMKQHPAAGERIMRPINLAPEVISGILQHHERLDGKGYPANLRDEKLSLTARILKIADVYDALVSERQYKKAWPVEKALALLHEQKGVEFDARMVEVFISRMAPEGWTPEKRENDA